MWAAVWDQTRASGKDSGFEFAPCAEWWLERVRPLALAASLRACSIAYLLGAGVTKSRQRDLLAAAGMSPKDGIWGTPLLLHLSPSQNSEATSVVWLQDVLTGL